MRCVNEVDKKMKLEMQENAEKKVQKKTSTEIFDGFKFEIINCFRSLTNIKTKGKQDWSCMKMRNK